MEKWKQSQLDLQPVNPIKLPIRPKVAPPKATKTVKITGKIPPALAKALRGGGPISISTRPQQVLEPKPPPPPAHPAVMRFSGITTVENLEELFADSPWLKFETSNQEIQYAYGWLPWDHALSYQNKMAFGPVLLKRYRNLEDMGISRAASIKAAAATCSVYADTIFEPERPANFSNVITY